MIRPILKHTVDTATQWSVAPSGSSCALSAAARACACASSLVPAFDSSDNDVSAKGDPSVFGYVGEVGVGGVRGASET